MFDAEIRFVSRKYDTTEKLVDFAWQYAIALHRNGQIADDFSVSRKVRHVRVLCIIPERCSLETPFHDAKGKAKLRRMTRLIARPAVSCITGEATETPPSCSCGCNPSLHLFTTLFDNSSPLKCGGCRRPVPFYRLRRLDLGLREGLLRWQWAYQACDRLFMHSGFGEMWGYRHMSTLNSRLTKEGQDLCAELEGKLRTPVFYYLHRYWGRSLKRESKRRCPSCGGAWLLSQPLGGFDLKCDTCRLLSNQAVDFTDARINVQAIAKKRKK